MDDSVNVLPHVTQSTAADRDNQQTEHNSTDSTAQNSDYQNHDVKNLFCFWTIGICNSFGWTVLGSATFDIINRLNGNSETFFLELGDTSYSRDCIKTSPAYLLMANTFPSIILKLILPFIPFLVSTNMILSSLLSIVAFAVVAAAQNVLQVIIGIIFMSLGATFGDITTLAYLSKFKDRKNILLANSSGVGASGVAAAFSYAALSDVGFTPKTLLLLMIVVPLLQIMAFLFIKESNAIELTISDSLSTESLIDDCTDDTSVATSDASPMTASEKWQYLPKLTKYMIPMLINCLFEYCIYQMFDILYIPGIWLDHGDQYRWLQVIGQIGGLFGRSSLSYIDISIDEVWPLNLLMGSFMLYFVYEAIFMTVPIIWIIFIFVFFVGFVSGCTVLSVFYRLTNETPAKHQVFAMCSVSNGLTVGVLTAATVAIPIHNAICRTPSPL